MWSSRLVVSSSAGRIPLSFGLRGFMLSQFVSLLGCYVAGIAVACAVSFGVFTMCIPLAMWVDSVSAFVLCLIIVGFSGVFTGALCLPRSSRKFGSFALLLLGLCFYTYVVFSVFAHGLPPNKFPLIWNLPLGGGGLLACLALCFWKRKPNQHLQETPR